MHYGSNGATPHKIFALLTGYPKANSTLKFLLIFTATLLIAEKKAYAYTDPGSGMLLWQGLLAALFGITFYSRKILSLFIVKLRRMAGLNPDRTSPHGAGDGPLKPGETGGRGKAGGLPPLN